MHCALPKLYGSGALVAKSVSLPNTRLLLFVGAVAWLHLFLGALVHPLPHFVPHPPPFFRF
jgi:hypothetical protein